MCDRTITLVFRKYMQSLQLTEFAEKKKNAKNIVKTNRELNNLHTLQTHAFSSAQKPTKVVFLLIQRNLCT